MDDSTRAIMFGFVIVLVVGINIILIFGNLTNFGGEMQITGFASASCKNTIAGVKCGSTVYEAKISGCSKDLVSACTNACELSKIKAGDDRICPAYCTELCVPADVAKKIAALKA